MRNIFLPSALAVLAIVPRAADANELQPYSYDERAKRSDGIIIGSVLSLSRSAVLECCDNFATIKVVRVLKGPKASIVNVFTQHVVMDLDPRCCKLGKTYLFFLSTRPGGTYAVVDGHFGAIPLD